MSAVMRLSMAAFSSDNPYLYRVADILFDVFHKHYFMHMLADFGAKYTNCLANLPKSMSNRQETPFTSCAS